MVTRVIFSILILSAMPLAVYAWVAGAHVTPEQRQAHAASVARHGYHHHVAPMDAPSSADLLPLDGATAGLGPALPGVPGIFWHASAFLSALVLGVAPARRQVTRRWSQPAPGSHQQPPLTPPPRPFAIA